MKKSLLIIPVLVFSLLFSPPQHTYARPLNTWPGNGYYGECNGSSWSMYVDFKQTQGMFFVQEGHGEYVSGYGFKELAYGWDGYYSILWVGWNGVSSLGLNLYYDTSWVTFTGSAHNYRFQPWAHAMSSWAPTVASSHLDTSPSPEAQFAGIVQFAGPVDSYNYYLTGMYFSGPYTGECPISDYPQLPASINYSKPYRETDFKEKTDLPSVEDLITVLEGSPVYASVTGTITHLSLLNGFYRVIITDSEDITATYNGLSSIYVKMGDTVSAGCQIGIAGPKVANTTSTYTDALSQFFFIVKDDAGTKQDWDYWIFPVGNKPCSTPTGNCSNANPNLDDKASGWQVHDYNPFSPQPIIKYDDSIQLAYADTMFQTVVLSDPSNWYVTLVATQVNDQQVMEVEYQIDVTIGEDTLYHRYTTTSLTEQVIEVGPFSPSTPDYSPDLYDLTIANGSSHSKGLLITFACLHQANEMTVTPGYCYFPNWQFQDHDEGWTSSSGVIWRDIITSPGYQNVTLPAGESISAPVSLTSYDDADADYQLWIQVNVSDNDLTDIWDLIVVGWESDFSQQVMDGETVELDIGDQTTNWVIPLTIETDFTVTQAASPLEGDLTIKADVANTHQITITQVCIKPETGIWPGQEDDDLTIDLPVCDRCVSPDSLNLAEWINWVMCGLNYFFYCSLAKWINDIGQTIYNTVSGIGYLGRWLYATITGFGIYLHDLASSIGELFLDILQGALATLWNWIAGLALLTSIYDLLGLLWAILTGSGQLVSLLVTLMTNILGIIATLANIIGGFKDALFTAINASSVVSTTMPTCTVPSDPLYGMCIGLDMVSAIFDEFPVTAGSMYVVAGVAGIITMVWTVRELGDAAGNVK